MKILISLLLFLFVSCISVFSQNKGQTLSHQRDTIRVELILGKSSDNDFTKGKEAEIVGTFPESDTLENSWLANAYLQLGLSSDSSRWSFGLTAEIHRNTLIEKGQDVRQFGISVGKVLVLSRSAIGASNFDQPLNLSVKHSEDKVKDTKEVQAIFGTTFQRFVGPQVLKTQSLFPAYSSKFAKAFMFSHNHNVGLAYLDEDDVLLGQFDFEFNLFFLPVLSDKWIGKVDFFKAQFTYKGRTEFFGNAERDLNSQLNFQVGLNYPFGKDDANSVGVAYDWISGADPLKGLDNQDYNTITIKTKLALK